MSVAFESAFILFYFFLFFPLFRVWFLLSTSSSSTTTSGLQASAINHQLKDTVWIIYLSDFFERFFFIINKSSDASGMYVGVKRSVWMWVAAALPARVCRI